MGRWFHFSCFEARNPLAFPAVSALFVCTTRPFNFFFHNSSPLSLQTLSPAPFWCLGWYPRALLCYVKAPLMSHIPSLKSYIWSDIFVFLLVYGNHAFNGFADFYSSEGKLLTTANTWEYQYMGKVKGQQGLQN